MLHISLFLLGEAELYFDLQNNVLRMSSDLQILSVR